MLALSDVTAAYDQVPVLNGLNLELKRGEVLALLGRNGVGKTTLLRTIMGLLPRSSGSTRL
jgi:ABC-type branched-subunit amino acid transport system ATPase component